MLPKLNHYDSLPGVVVNPACAIVIGNEYFEISIRHITVDAGIRVLSKVFSRSAGVPGDIEKWLCLNMVKDVAIQGDGNSWRMICDRLENSFSLHLTHCNDLLPMVGFNLHKNESEKIAELLQYGLLKTKFIPDRFTRELQDMTRMREEIIERISMLKCRIRLILEESGISPSLLRSFKGMLDGKNSGLYQDEKGFTKIVNSSSVSENKKLILNIYASDLSKAEMSFNQISNSIAVMDRKYSNYITRLIEIPGLIKRYAERIVAETGTNYECFDSYEDLLTWAGMVPFLDNKNSKKDTGKIGKSGREWFKRAITDSAIGVVNAGSRTISGKYKELLHKYGVRKSMLFMEQAIVYLVFRIIKEGKRYHELEKDIQSSFFLNQSSGSVQLKDGKALAAPCLGNKINFNETWRPDSD